MAKQRPPTEAKLLELLETVYPTVAHSASPHNIRHFVENSAKDQGQKMRETQSAAADIRSLIRKACDGGVVSSERQWAVMCRRIEQRIQKTKNTLRFALLSRKLEEAFAWARAEVNADDVSFEETSPEAGDARDAIADAEPEPVAPAVPDADEEAAFAAMLAEEAREKELLEEWEGARVRELATGEHGSGFAPVETPPATPAGECVAKTDAPPRKGFIETIEEERGDASPERFLVDRTKEFLWAVFDGEFLCQLRTHAEELGLDEELSAETVKRIVKLLTAVERSAEEKIRAALPAIVATHTDAQDKDAVEAAMMQGTWNAIRDALREAEDAVQERIMRHGLTGKTDLPRVVLDTFRTHCLENCRSYLDIITTPDTALGDLPRLTLKAPETRTGQREKSPESLKRERVVRQLAPSRAEGSSVPLSQRETEYVLVRIDGMKKRMNGERRADLMRDLADRFSGGIALRDEEYFRTVIEPSIHALLKLRRERDVTETLEHAASAEPAAPAEAPRAATREERLRAYLEQNVVTPEELSTLQAVLHVKAHRKDIHRRHFAAIVEHLNERCWAGQPERDATFVESLIEALRTGIVSVPAPEMPAAETDDATEEPDAAATESSEEAEPAAAADDAWEIPADTAQAIDDGIVAGSTQGFIAPVPAADSFDENYAPETAAHEADAALPAPETRETAVPDAPETTERSAAFDGYAARLAKRIEAHAAPQAVSTRALLEELLTLANRAEELLEELEDSLHGLTREADAVRTGAVILRHGDITDERVRAIGYVSSVDELRAAAQDFLRHTEAPSAKLAAFEAAFRDLQGRVSVANADANKTARFFARELPKLTLTENETEARAFVRATLGNEYADRMLPDPSLADADQEMSNAYDGIINGVLKDLLAYQDVPRRRDDAVAILEILGGAPKPAKKEMSVHHQIPSHAATPESTVVRPDAPAPLREKESLHAVVATMTMRSKREEKTYGLSLLQTRLLQLLSVFPSVTQNRESEDVKPRSALYPKIWQGRSVTEIMALWQEMFGDVPDKEELLEALNAISGVGTKGMEKERMGPNYEDRKNAVTPLLKFRNIVGHIRYLPADATYGYVRSLNGGLEITPEFERKLVGLLDAKEREKQAKNAKLQKPKEKRS